jgi:hypothetical protein
VRIHIIFILPVVHLTSLQFYFDCSTFRGEIKTFARPIVENVLGFSTAGPIDVNITLFNGLTADNNGPYLHGDPDVDVAISSPFFCVLLTNLLREILIISQTLWLRRLPSTISTIRNSFISTFQPSMAAGFLSKS